MDAHMDVPVVILDVGRGDGADGLVTVYEFEGDVFISVRKKEVDFDVTLERFNKNKKIKEALRDFPRDTFEAFVEYMEEHGLEIEGDDSLIDFVMSVEQALAIADRIRLRCDVALEMRKPL